MQIQVWLKLGKNIRCFIWRPKYVLYCWQQHKCSSTIQKSILIIKPTRCTISQIYFDKVLHMFRTDLLSIIKSLNTVYTAIGICHASSVDCLLARSDPSWPR